MPTPTLTPPQLNSQAWLTSVIWAYEMDKSERAYRHVLLQTMMVRDQDNEFQELRTSHMNPKLNATVIFLSLHPLQNKETLELELQF